MADFPKQLLANPSGFPDLTPAEAITMNRFLDVIRKHFELTGYAPIETPLVERTEVLTTKAEGEINTQIYGLRLLNPAEGSESDEKNLALRFDHTVPLARYLAAHYSELQFPFRRYAIGSVLRGERAKEGRYRQFIQADIDAIGENTLSSLFEAEMVAVLVNIFNELAIGDFLVLIGHRKTLSSIIAHMGGQVEDVQKLIRAIDKLEKVGKDETVAALVAIGMQEKSAQQMIDFITAKRSVGETLAFLESSGSEGASELREVVAAIEALGVPENRYTIDLSIARGLDYYTGVVYETTLTDHPEIGSIASGGRYDDLASAFINRKLPGVGISIGVTRLLLRLIKAGLVHADASTIAKVLITSDANDPDASLSLAHELRSANIPCEIYFGSKSAGEQRAYAQTRGFALAVTPGEPISIKNLTSNEEQTVSGEIVAAVQKLLS